MNKLLSMLCCAVMLLLTAGCTSNNGDIGEIFGQWKLERIDTQGMATDPTPGLTMTWAFQNTTVRVLQMTDAHQSRESYGNFRIADETLFLDFADEDYPMLIPDIPRQSEWQILHLDKSKLTVRYQYPDESSMIWYFKKW